MHAGSKEGELVTKPIVFSGQELVLNLSTGAAGGLRVEVQDAKGGTLGGFELEHCPVVFGDEIERVVKFTPGSDLGSLAGRPVRLRFVMKECDLYSYRFR